MAAPAWGPQEQPWILSWLYAVVGHIRSAVSNATMSESERNLDRMIELGASRLGARLLAAADLDDLDDRLDDVVESPEMTDYGAMMFRVASDLPRPETSDVVGFAGAVSTVLGSSQANMLIEANPLVSAWMMVHQTALVHLEGLPGASSEAEQLLRSVSVSDADLPPEMARALAGALRASVIPLAFVRAMLTGSRLEPWLAHALVERFVGGLREHLRYLASVFPGVVPEDVVPLEDYIDHEAIVNRHSRARYVAKQALLAEQTRRS